MLINKTLSKIFYDFTVFAILQLRILLRPYNIMW